MERNALPSLYQIKGFKGFGNDSLQVCSTAGINLLSRERARFADLARSLQSTIVLLKRANSDEEYGARAVLALSIIKASCVAFVDMAGTLGDLAGLKGTKQAAGWLGAGSKGADFVIGKSTGQKTDGFGVAKSFGDAALGSKYGDKLGAHKDIAELQMIKIDILKSAIAGDKEGLKRDVFLGYLAKVSEMTLTALKQEAAAKMLGAYAALAKSGAEYSGALDQAFDDKIASQVEVGERRRQIKMAMAHLATAMSQIKVIDSVIADCRGGGALAVKLG